MGKLLHYINEATDEEYIVLENDSGEDWQEDSYKLESETELDPCPITLPSNRIIEIKH